MVYVPIICTSANVDDAVFKNIFRIVDEYKTSNTSITIQDKEDNITYPINVLYIPDITKRIRDFSSNNKNVEASIQIDFDALYESQGYQKCSEMHTAIENGLDTENSQLHTARLRYKGSEVVSSQPIAVNGQQVLSKSVRFDFEVLI
jgi:hypothetical protein